MVNEYLFFQSYIGLMSLSLETLVFLFKIDCSVIQYGVDSLHPH